LFRSSRIERRTKETNVKVAIELDGTGEAEITTSIPFLDHMLDLFARHSLFNLNIAAEGDLEVDSHHTVEDIGISLGQALKKALGDKRGIRRYGDILLPMDEALVLTAVDISGRAYLAYDIDLQIEVIGNYDTSLTVEFMQALVNNAELALHVQMLRGGNAHHVTEAVFKGLGRALDQATSLDPRVSGVPSTKGKL